MCESIHARQSSCTVLSDDLQQQKYQDDEENEADAASSVIADSWPQTISTKSKHQDKNDENNKHDASRFTEGVRCVTLPYGFLSHLSTSTVLAGDPALLTGAVSHITDKELQKELAIDPANAGASLVPRHSPLQRYVHHPLGVN
jgi:hypothetical protein